MGVAVSVAVAVTVGVGVSSGVAVSVGVGVAVGVAVSSGVSVAVAVAVTVTVGVGVGVLVGPVGSAEGVDVGVGVVVESGVGVTVLVGVGVLVAVGVTVGVGSMTLHSAGYGPTAGAPAALTHSTLKSVTQARHDNTSGSVEMGAAQLGASLGGSTAGHSSAKPKTDGCKSSGVPHCLSGPPQIEQMRASRLRAARAIFEAPRASGHGPLNLPAITASSHLPITFSFASKYFVDSLPSARWHLPTARSKLGIADP